MKLGSLLAASLAALVLLWDASCEESPLSTEATAAPPDLAVPVAAVSLTSDVSLPFHKILCFGDSITYGVTLADPPPVSPTASQGQLTVVEGYVPKLWRRLESKYGSGFELLNDGAPGEGSRAAVKRIAREMRDRSPELVLLLEGVIDVDNDAPDFPTVRDNLREIVRIARGGGAEILLGTYPLLNPEGFRATNPENIPKLNEIVRRLAREEGLVVADHERAFRDLSGQGPDGLHPNDLGYEVMADTWLAAIESLAAAPGAR